MNNYVRNMQREKEIKAWNVFKKVVQECLSLQFDEKQLLMYVQMQYCNIKGGVKGVDEI